MNVLSSHCGDNILLMVIKIVYSILPIIVGYIFESPQISRKVEVLGVGETTHMNEMRKPRIDC